VDPGCAPQPIGLAHLPDQIADLLRDRRTAASGPGLPPSKGLENPADASESQSPA
jgi:hypothetical protein